MCLLQKDQIRKIIYPNRYDIAIKYVYFKHMLNNTDYDEVKTLYKWFIQKRTRGVEKRSNKHCVTDYTNAIPELLQSMQLNGFNKDYPIKVDNRLWIHGGSHRLACSLVLNIEPIFLWVEAKYRLRPWNIEWAEQRKLDKKYTRLLEECMEQTLEVLK